MQISHRLLLTGTAALGTIAAPATAQTLNLSVGMLRSGSKNRGRRRAPCRSGMIMT